MDPPKRSPIYAIDILTDPVCAKDIIKGILHTVMFHRIFEPLRPITRDILDVSLMVVDSPDLDSLIDARATSAVRKLESATSTFNGNNGGLPCVTLKIELTERRRKNKQGYLTFAFSKPVDEEFVWETWMVNVVMQRARNEEEADMLRERMESRLRTAAMKVSELAGGEKDHVPPITQVENPFPYRIAVGELGVERV